MAFVVHLGHEILHPVAAYIFLQIRFLLGEVLSSQIEE